MLQTLLVVFSVLVVGLPGLAASHGAGTNRVDATNSLDHLRGPHRDSKGELGMARGRQAKETLGTQSISSIFSIAWEAAGLKRMNMYTYTPIHISRRLQDGSNSTSPNYTETGPEFVGACEVDNAKRQVEESPGYIGYQAVFWLGYAAVAVWSMYGTYQIYRQMQAKAPGRRVNICDNNRAVVLATITLGALVRALSFIDLTAVYNGCIGEEILRCIKDVCFLMSFLLIVLFWVELYSSISQRSNIDAYKPVLYAVLGVYSSVRTLNAIFELAIREPSWPATVTSVVSFLIYLGVMIVAAIYGGQLICKIQSIGGGGAQADRRAQQAWRMTQLLIGEMVVLLLLALVFGLRQTAFYDASEDDPWLWFWLKVLEKVFELVSIGILCAVMARQGESKGAEGEQGGGGTGGAGAGGRQRAGSRAGDSKEASAADPLQLTPEERARLAKLPPSKRGAAKKKLLQAKRRALAEAGQPVEVSLTPAEQAKIKAMPPSKRGAAKKRMLRQKREKLEGTGAGAGAGVGKHPPGKGPPGKRAGGVGKHGALGADSKEGVGRAGAGAAGAVEMVQVAGQGHGLGESKSKGVDRGQEQEAKADEEGEDEEALLLNDVDLGALERGELVPGGGADGGPGAQGSGPGTGSGTGPTRRSRVHSYFGSLFSYMSGASGGAAAAPSPASDSPSAYSVEDPLVAQRAQTGALLEAAGGPPASHAAQSRAGIGVWVEVVDEEEQEGGAFYFPLLLPTLVQRKQPHGKKGAAQVVHGSSDDPVEAAVPVLEVVLAAAARGVAGGEEEDEEGGSPLGGLESAASAPRADPATLREAPCRVLLGAETYTRLGRLLRAAIAAARRGGVQAGPSSLGARGSGGKASRMAGAGAGSGGLSRGRALSRGRRGARRSMNPMQLARGSQGAGASLAGSQVPGSSFSLGGAGAQLRVKQNPLRQHQTGYDGGVGGGAGVRRSAMAATGADEGEGDGAGSIGASVRHWPGALLPSAPATAAAGSSYAGPSEGHKAIPKPKPGTRASVPSGADAAHAHAQGSSGPAPPASKASPKVPKPGTKVRPRAASGASGGRSVPRPTSGTSKRPGPPSKKGKAAPRPPKQPEG